ncbi:AAA family ATPase [Ruminococcus sp.]|uniref:AAA family ATPase n=1 Tax=Ruminococcus sp. TaxID=41978 RepID=UPI00386A644C
MKLIYAYIKRFRNIIDQEISFSHRYGVTYDPKLPFPEALTITYNERDAAVDVLFSDSQLVNVHVIVGRTGAGKSNVFQMIGMPEEERALHGESGDSYFLLYEAKDGFAIEPYNIAIDPDIIPRRMLEEAEQKLKEEKKLLPAYAVDYVERLDSMYIYHFGLSAAGKPVDLSQLYHAEELEDDLTFVFNGYERHAFSHCPYEETRLESNEPNTIWQPRINAEYHKTALWNSCRFLNEYICSFDEDNIKRRTAFVVESQNWAKTIKQHIDESLEASDYWTYVQRARLDDENRIMGKSVAVRRKPPVKVQFIHDLLTDYALYLREWISYIETWPNSVSEEGRYALYYLKKNKEMDTYRTGSKQKQRTRQMDPLRLPDYEKMSVRKRIQWLAMWIDLRGNDTPHSLLYQISGDIIDIADILMKFDDKYFTKESFTLPVTDMYLDNNKGIVEDLFERMEQYRPDDTGLFTAELLPYHFSCVSSGEYQLAKVLGGIEEYCVKLSVGKEYGQHPNLIYLLDEPETYMHPELCRLFMKKLDAVLKERSASSDIQVLISTHSPQMLSDVLPDQITRLDLDSKGRCIIKNGTDKAYFGANIHTILADGFFLDYTIGEFARTVLQEKLDWLRGLLEKSNVSDEDMAQLKVFKTVIPMIGDSLIRNSFELMIEQIGDR